MAGHYIPLGVALGGILFFISVDNVWKSDGKTCG